MKKRNIFKALGIALLSFGIGGCAVWGATSVSAQYAIVRADGDDPVPPEYECSVVVPTVKHGTITVDKTEGHVGDVVTVTANHDLFYLTDFVAVNGSNLVESEEVSGQYSFLMVEGVNEITAKFVIDEELLGDLSVIVEQISNKDWKALFSVDNVIRIAAFILNGGLLLAMIRYYVKDKKLAKRLEETTKKTLAEVVPDVTKQTVLATINDLIKPIFAEIIAKVDNQNEALTVFSRCLALAQENTPEAKMAIIRELSSIKISDKESIESVRRIVEAYIEANKEEMAELTAQLQEIKAQNAEVIGDETVETPVDADNGIQI